MKTSGFSLLSVLTVLSLFGMPAAAYAQTHYIIYHDDSGNVVTYDPWQEGYTFHNDSPTFFLDESSVNVGWSTAPGGSGTVYREGDTLSSLSADLNLYALTQRGYWMSFDTQGGTPVESRIVFTGQLTVKPEDPVRNGFVFSGWEYNGSAFTFGSPLTSDIILTAKWTTSTVPYTVRVWTENPNHPSRGSLEEAIANSNSDYFFRGSFSKQGAPGSAVEITDADHSSDFVRDIIDFKHEATRFPVYFCDDSYGSYALSMTNSSIARVNANGGISPESVTIIDVYYRSLTFKINVTDSGLVDGTSHSYEFNCRNEEILGNALQRSGVSINQAFYDQYLTKDLHTVPYVFVVSTESGYNVTNEPLFVDTKVENIITFSPNAVVSDGFVLTYKFQEKTKGDHQFIRAYYYQTLSSAKAGNETDYNNSVLSNYTLKDEDVYLRTNTTMNDGCLLDAELEGFTLFFYQIVQRERDDLPFYADLYARNGANYKYYRTSSASGWTHIIGNPDYSIKKFNYLPYRNTADMSKDGGKWENISYKLEIFYKRNSYNVSFSTGTDKFNLSPLPVFYQQPLKEIESRVVYTDSKGTHHFVAGETSYADDHGVIWIFDGWYDNEAFAGAPIDLSTTSLVMPAGNIQIYAKWSKKTITVTFDAGTGTIGGSHTKQITMESGLVPPSLGDAIPATGLYFYCWVYKGSKYEFTRPIYDNATLTAVYYNNDTYKLTYSAGAGSGDAPVDSATYLVNANTVVAAPGADMLPPSWKQFDCWQDKNGVKYYPGDIISLTGNTVLTALYADYLIGLTIKTSGMKPGDSSIFTVCPEGSSTPVNTVVITAGTDGEGSAVVAGVTSGRYTVTETPWNWTYSSSVSRVLTQDLEENNVFEFTSSARESLPANNEKNRNNWHE